MSVRRNHDWGEPGPMPSNAVVMASDREVSRMVEWSWAAHEPLPAVGLVGGDLRRALGGQRSSRDLQSDVDVLGAVVDVGSVIVDGTQHAFVAQVIARSRWWSGAVFAVMNSEWLGDWIVAPRAHPGDGRFDLVEARLSIGDRIKARRRLRTGTHVPHPSIHVRTITTTDIEFGGTRSIYVDGERIGRATAMQIECHREALHVYV
ncbi:MAG: hypothetical protein E6G39_02340 [Actinobacteria bacterium]|nr:MAG: hypothetical protein E6G39_02340 [Actinomycetota bacterium]